MIEKLSFKDFFKSGQQQFAIEPRVPQSDFPEHTHDFSELVIVTEGRGRHILNGYPHDLHKGMVLYIEATDHHLYENVDNLCLTNILLKDYNDFKFIRNLDTLLKNLKPNCADYKIINRDTLGLINENITLLMHSQNFKAKYSSAMVETALQKEFSFFQLVTLLQNHYIDGQMEGSMEAKGRQIINWLNFHFGEEISWDKLAEKFNLSIRTLYRYVKMQTGLTPQAYVSKLRLSNAYYQLRYTEKPITDIALDCGFNDGSYFSTCFKHEFGLSPKTLRG
ncbi:HTH-type transcriptional activator RhaS [Bisgaard Taxon 10/6]|uniref:HTH-type transcriptional activator RhaS n=1 Tax=Exercitatus varius TaxID=67857 RepID=UPI00294B9383|nr:HTH-type transcriptional activator RhaS [Exercitatus varius]MDG2954171.1 HTH-type transcriptional activator RhaS [Exercitatus varius]